jgi:serine/threonine protein kinase
MRKDTAEPFEENFFVLRKSPAVLAWSADGNDGGQANELTITPDLVVETSDIKVTHQYCLHLTTKKGQSITLKACDQSVRNDWEREIVQLVAQKATRDKNCRRSFSAVPSDNIFKVPPLSPTKSHVLQGTTFDLPTYFQPIKVIGSGAYGLVISAKNRRTGETVAIKKISGVFEDLEDGKRIVRESKLLRHLRHPQVVEILDIIPAPPSKKNGMKRNDCRRANDVYMVLPLMDSDLHKVISSKVALKDEHVKYFLYQLLRACQHCHSKGVLHRDIKPANILVNANCDLKLCDFGLARSPPTTGEEKDLQSTMTEYVVTRWYRAPELLLCLSEYDEAIDVWAVGCVFAELLLREPIFAGRDYSHQLELMSDALWLPPTARLEKWVTNRQALNFVTKLRSKQRQRRGAAKQKRRDEQAHEQQKDNEGSSSGTSSPIKMGDADTDLGLKTSLRQRLIAKGIEEEAVELLMSMLEIDPCMRVGVDGAMSHPYLADLHAQHWPSGDSDEEDEDEEEEDEEEEEEDGRESTEPETLSPPVSKSPPPSGNINANSSSTSSTSSASPLRRSASSALSSLMGGREVQRISPTPPGEAEAVEEIVEDQSEALGEASGEQATQAEAKRPVRLLQHEDFQFESMGKLTKPELQQLMMDEIARYRPNF